MKLFPLVPLASLVMVSGCVVIVAGNKGDVCDECGARRAHAKSEAQVHKGLLFDVDFGPPRGSASKQSGAAAVGKPGDFWNTVAKSFNDAHTEDDLKWADGSPCPIRVEMRNLGGGWGFSGGLGMESPMINDFNYPANNQGGSSHVILHEVPPGKYDLLLYGQGTQPDYFGKYEVSVGDQGYGQRSTYSPQNFGQDKKWIENRQYVKFSNLSVENGAPITITIHPGNPVIAPGNRTIADAIIAGLQLVRK